MEGCGFNGRVDIKTKDTSEANNVAAAHPEKVAAMQQRLDALSKEAAKPLFFEDQFKVVMRNMNGEPVLPIDEGYGESDHQ